MRPEGRAEGRAKRLCCGPELSRWAASDDPRQEHYRPSCLYGRVLGQDRVDGQILGQLQPLTEEEESSGAPAFPEMGSEELRLASFYDWPSTAGVRPEPLAAAGFFHTGPSGLLARWAPGHEQGPEPAPLLHTGQQDKVRCFFCYGGLQSWEHGDDPWTEHAKWFPRCQFLLRSKGRGFVHSVQEAWAPLLSSWDRWEEPEDAAAAAPSDDRGSQEWSAQSHRPDVPTSTSPSQLVANLLQEEDGDQVAGPRASVHGVSELLVPRTETRPEGAGEPGAGDAWEQLRQLQEERMCKVCLDRAVSVVFVPCGHLVCAECAPSLQLCPICRAPVRSRVRTFLS